MAASAAEGTDQGVKAANTAYQRVPARFWPKVSPKGMRKIAALVADEGVTVDDACLLEGYAPSGLAAMLEESEDSEKYGNMLDWAKADSRRKWLRLLRKASQKGRGAKGAATMLQAIDGRFQPKKVDGEGQGITIQFVVVGGSAPKVRELETRIVQVDPKRQLGDGT